MALEPDIVDRINRTFPPEDAPQAVKAVSEAGLSERVARCVVVAAGGSRDLLLRYVEVAHQDDRDAIVAGEYDETYNRLRDLRVSFLIDEPSKFWIAEVAARLAKRGYRLATLHTTAVVDRPVECTSALGEGTATFDGDLGTLTVVKEGGRWSLKAPAAELERYGLSRTFADEQEFCDAVSGYILTKRMPLE